MFRMRIAWLPIVLMAVACGSDGGDNGVTFSGTVTSVTPQQTAAAQSGPRRWLADVRALAVADAVAQSSCPALHVLACASNGSDPQVCERVNASSCNFSVTVPADAAGFISGQLTFVDDQNGDRRPTTGEPVAALIAVFGRLCEGTVVKLDGVSMNFTAATAVASSIRKDPDTCTNATPTPVQTPYGLAAPLNASPSTPMAMLFGSGVVALLIPIRRRRRRG